MRRGRRVEREERMTNFGVEEEDEAAEASHAAVVVEVVFAREDRRLAVFHHKLLLNLATKTKSILNADTHSILKTLQDFGQLKVRF